MGFFSWDCQKCGKSARCQMAVGETAQSFMSDVVVFFENGDRITGEYDGYGNIGGSLNLADARHRFTLYHLRCWEELSEVTKGFPSFSGQSKSSRDQGWFFDSEKDDGKHTLLD